MKSSVEASLPPVLCSSASAVADENCASPLEIELFKTGELLILKQMAVIQAIVIQGHRVASGGNGDPRFPGGTLRMQLPFFNALGLDLSNYYLATLNLSIAPFLYEPRNPRFEFKNVAWHPTEPAEDFSFFSCRIRQSTDASWIDGFIYYPHPETKPEHFQPPDMLEVLAKSKIDGIDYGSSIELEVSSDQMKFTCS